MMHATKNTWIFLMKSKSKVRQLILSFSTMFHTQFELRIKAIRTNNGVEFHMLEFFNVDGIIHQHSYVYTPQKNSIVERKHQHLLSIARALQIQSHLPIQFQGDCVLNAAYLISKLPSPLLNDKTPFELLFHKALDYGHLKVFGCLCFASTTAQTRNKFSPKARKCVFLRYPFNVKGSKLFDLQFYTATFPGMLCFMKLFFPMGPLLLLLLYPILLFLFVWISIKSKKRLNHC